jgi:hypothetical protein
VRNFQESMGQEEETDKPKPTGSLDEVIVEVENKNSY